MAIQITTEQMMTYQATARRRRAEEQRHLMQRHEQAWALARQAAALLRERFGAERIAAFGSLVHPELFHAQSDVDLAVWGLDQQQYYRAVAQLLALDPTVEIDLVMVEDASAPLRGRIEAEGVIL
jgi:predicted nucleotidyltransferase